MKLKTCTLLWLSAALAFSATAAQPTPAPALNRGNALVRAARTADDAWSIVTTLPSSASQKNRTPADVLDRDRLTPGEAYIEASLAAREFRDAFPADARKGEARKLEAFYALQGVQAGAAHYQTAATALASSYRSDPTNSKSDRFDVAFLMEGIAFAESLKGKRFIDDGVRYEALADALHAELGGTEEVFGLYISIVRTTDTASSLRVANKLLLNSAAPKWAKAEAQMAVDRGRLIGKPLDLKLTTMGGHTLNLSQPNDRPTVVYFWHASAAPADFAALDHFKPTFKREPRYIYVGLGTQPPISDRPMAGSPFALSHCFEAAQIGQSAVSTFKVQQTPYAVVLDPAGHLVGYGPPERIAALLETAAR